ncbi:MAG TPA: type II toxin-antitoxin system prevent-host-death family antitoxin [Verrucomicrobiae bacterium]|nr:type II toxin-antitoxin system prevent-host-death family antitoxin [Verrucomicrobiae bacterium]
MTKATITQAKTRLGKLIDAALRGERVVIMRGSKPAAAIVPVDSNGSPDLRVSDAAADFLAREARTELNAGVAQVHESPAVFASAVTKPRRRA